MNQKEIDLLKHDGKDRQLSLGNSLYLNIRKNSKTYIIRKRIERKVRVTTLGKHPVLKLKDAVFKTMDFVREKTVDSVLVAELKKDYYETQVVPYSKVPKQVIGYLDHIEIKFGNRKVRDITKFELVQFIEKYSSDRGARSSDRIRSYLIQLFSYAAEKGLIENSPMLGVSKRVTGYQQIDRKRVLSDDEIRMVWNWKNASKGWQQTEDNARVIKFLLLTGLRISEAQSGYIDGDKFRVDDSKGKHALTEKRPHWVYLTDTAKALLPLPKSTATNIQAWLRRKLEAESYTKEKRFTPHDCRRTYATRANTIGVVPHIVEKTLNHKLEGMMAVYNHSEYEAERIDCALTVEKHIIEVLACE